MAGLGVEGGDREVLQVVNFLQTVRGAMLGHIIGENRDSCKSTI